MTRLDWVQLIYIKKKKKLVRLSTSPTNQVGLGLSPTRVVGLGLGHNKPNPCGLAKPNLDLKACLTRPIFA